MAEIEPQGFKGSAQKFDRVKSQNHITLYINSALVIATQWDFQLNLAMIHEGPPGQYISEEMATVVMTPEHALALTKVLSEALTGYEDSQGSIRIIKSVNIESSAAPVSTPKET